MICVTGDVHQRSYRGTDTAYSDRSEVELARAYCEIAHGHGVKVTLFVTGKACIQEMEGVQRLSQYRNCEIGGHTFSALQSPVHRVFRLLKRWFPSRHGPRSWQLADIRRTMSALAEVTGEQVQVWRNHSYIRDQHTHALLGMCGIRVISDEVSSNQFFPWELMPSLLSLPINTLPDHENLLHGRYRPGHTKDERLAGRLTIDEWGEQVREKILEIRDHGGIATVLAHPLCMEVADGMKTFEQICQFASGYGTIFVSETRQYVRR